MLTAERIATESGSSIWPDKVGRVVRGVIVGPLPGKSNARRIFRRGPNGPRLLVKSAEAIAWVDGVKALRLHAGATIKTFVGDRALYLWAKVWQENMRRDLDVELLPDALQASGVIENDRAIWAKIYVRGIDKFNPRVEFEIGPCPLNFLTVPVAGFETVGIPT